MRTFEDAWIWYDHNRKLVNMMKRLGDRYWTDLPWAGKLGNDDDFRLLEGPQVQQMAQGVLEEFDDFGIFVLFSVFESIVRLELLESLELEVRELKHPALRRSAAKLLQNIKEGSFYNNVFDLFKREGQEPANQEKDALLEQVNRVRRYRNWVAHGRKDARPPDTMTPRNAYDALQAFLHQIQPEIAS